MPRIFNNIEEHAHFIEAIQRAVQDAYRGDFCVGYFNLRGWKAIADGIDQWEGGENACCRVRIGMQRRPEDELRSELNQFGEAPMMDNATAVRLRKQYALSLRNQITYGAPTNQDQAALQQLARQLRAGKVIVKLYLRHRLHAKLYLFHRHDPFTPIIGYLGSSNLTFAGLAAQGEIDESHNLRNREGKTYRAIREYLQINDSMVVLLSATPYNKTYQRRAAFPVAAGALLHPQAGGAPARRCRRAAGGAGAVRVVARRRR